MKIARAEYAGQTFWGEVEEQWFYALSDLGGSRIGEKRLWAEMRPLVPAQPSKIVCVGRNYLDHAREMGHATDLSDLPSEPSLFLKGPNALVANGQTVAYPSWTNEFHYEGELALVMKQTVKDLTPETALHAVLGYTCAIDLTARDAQRSDLQWFRAKSADHFCPLGPYLETDLSPLDLGITTRVNGQIRQQSRTSHMIFDAVQVLVYVTRFMTLEAGDVVLTGTPEGVGALQVGDSVEVEIEGIGTLLTRIGEQQH